jgi:hypothetical protein
LGAVLLKAVILRCHCEDCPSWKGEERTEMMVSGGRARGNPVDVPGIDAMANDKADKKGRYLGGLYGN